MGERGSTVRECELCGVWCVVSSSRSSSSETGSGSGGSSSKKRAKAEDG